MKKKTLRRIEKLSPSPLITKLAVANANTKSVSKRIKAISPSKATAKAARSLRATREPASGMLYKQRRPVDRHGEFRRWVDNVHRRLGVKRGRR
jgi:hypothetical protein